MPTSWKIYRLVCIIQMMIAFYLLFTSLISLFEATLFGDVTRVLVFLLVISLSIFAVSILNNNYPDIPVTGNQKKTFNWLFLFNFLFLAFLFGFIFSEYKALQSFALGLKKNAFQLPFDFLVTFIAYILIVIFQLIILYGLYILRQLLYENFRKQEFEFEQN